MDFDKIAWRPLAKEVALGDYMRTIALAYGAIRGGSEATYRLVKWVNRILKRELVHCEIEEYKRAMKVDFVDINLTTEDKTQVVEMSKDLEHLFSVVADVIEAGYKVTLRWDYKSKAYALFLFGGDGSPNKGKCITSRGRDFPKVVASLVYKHLVKKEGGQWAEANDDDMEWFD